MLSETGCDALMIGRGTYGNPWIFNQIKDAFEKRPVQQINATEKKTMALDHLKHFRDHFGEKAAVKEMKKRLHGILKAFQMHQYCVTRFSELKNTICCLIF